MNPIEPSLALLIVVAATLTVAGAAVLAVRRMLGGTRAAFEARASEAEGLVHETNARLQRLALAHAHGERELARLTEANSRLQADVASRDLRICELEAALAERGEAIGQLRAEHAALQASTATEREQVRRHMEGLQDARASMTREFRVLAEDVMREHGVTFKQQNQEKLGDLLNPLQTKIVEFRTELRTAQREAAEGRAGLREQISQLAERSTAMSQETQSLTRALRGQVQAQGAWGEMVLETILEKSGLRVGEEYVRQETSTGTDGTRLRPDVIVNLPNGHRIVIDSKVSLVAFERYVNADDEKVCATHLRDHLDSLRSHVRNLSDKGYAQVAGFTPDYVIMFIPIEGALAAALGADPALTAAALERNVTLATPTNLITLLRTVANIWQVEHRNRNAEEIADRAGKLYEKFVGFAEDLAGVGTRLEQAAGAHQAAMGKLASGRGNLVRQAEMLKSLGARTSKALPDELITASGAVSGAGPAAHRRLPAADE